MLRNMNKAGHNKCISIPEVLLHTLRQKLQDEYVELYGDTERLNYLKFCTRWHKSKANKSKKPNDQTLRNFYKGHSKMFRHWFIDGLCQALLDISFEEWCHHNVHSLPSLEKATPHYDPYMGLLSVRQNIIPQNLIDEIVLTNPRHVWLSGIHFQFSLTQKRHLYRSLLETGTTLKFLFLNPKSNCFKIQADQLEASSILLGACLQNIRCLSMLMKEWRQLAKDKNIHDFSSQIEAKFTDNIVYALCYFVDPQDPDAQSYIFPRINQTDTSQSIVFTCKNIPQGTSDRYFQGFYKEWTRATPFQSLLSADDELKALTSEYPDMLEDYPLPTPISE